MNEKFAINLLNEEAVTVVRDHHVWCDGGMTALYLNINYVIINRRWTIGTSKGLYQSGKDSESRNVVSSETK